VLFSFISERKRALLWLRPYAALKEDNLIYVDGDHQLFECGMPVRLKTEDPMRRWKDDAKELLKIGDVVCGPYTAADLDVEHENAPVQGVTIRDGEWDKLLLPIWPVGTRPVTCPPPATFNNSGPSSIATLQNRWRMGKDATI
jgi:hypothetical protein